MATNDGSDGPDTPLLDPWEQVARAAKAKAKAKAEQNAPICAQCRRMVVLTENGVVKVHFADAATTRPCPGSFKPWTG